MLQRILSFIMAFSLVQLSAQEVLIKNQSYNSRKNTIRSLPPNADRARAHDVLKSAGYPFRTIYPDGKIIEVRRIGEVGSPEFVTTTNRQAAETTSTYMLWNSYFGNNRGKGIVIGVWDGGDILDTHVEFGGRVRIIDPYGELSGHATHVAGTLGAKGVDSDATGMASEAILEGYQWNNDILEMDSAAAHGLLISNHSYGYVVGWNYNQDNKRWEWYGNSEVSEIEDYLFGFYHPESREYDRIAFDHPYYTIVKSAGNDRGEGPDDGQEHDVWSNNRWISSNSIRTTDGGSEGYETIGPVGTAKNIITVGAIGDINQTALRPGEVQVMDFSASGPTDDGRIKPDILGNGDELLSAYSEGNRSYAIGSGTSMATPNIAGSLALLQEFHYKKFRSYLRSSKLKGLVLHTATDVGNSGPDYLSGWGVLNALGALEFLRDTSHHKISVRGLKSGEIIRQRFSIDGNGPCKVSICWTDPPGTVPEASLDPADKILVNDLDLSILRLRDRKEYKPWVLDPMNPGRPAEKGDNMLDNIEQVLIDNPELGEYELVITHKGTLQNNRQDVAVLISTRESFGNQGTRILTKNNGAFSFRTREENQNPIESAWFIYPQNQQLITLWFDSLSVEPGQGKLMIYDSSNKRNLLAEIEGGSGEDSIEIQAPDGQLYIEFLSSGMQAGTGFHAFYCTTEPEDSSYIVGQSYPCINSQEEYFAKGQEGTQYRWNMNDDWMFEPTGYTSGMLSIRGDTGQLEVIPYNRCGEADPASIFLQPVKIGPVIDSVLVDSAICTGQMGYISLVCRGGTDYDWTLPDGWRGSLQFNKLEFIPTSVGGIIEVTPKNGCGYGDVKKISLVTNTIPDRVEMQVSTDTLCQSSVYRFSFKGAEDVDYSWRLQDGWSWSLMEEFKEDSASILTGPDSTILLIIGKNECGYSNSIFSYTSIQKPIEPNLSVTNNSYENLRTVKVDNPWYFETVQWCYNGEPIQGLLATDESYIAYLPGIYTVEVSNDLGCYLTQNIDDGIEVSYNDQKFAVFGGSSGTLLILNGTEKEAISKVFDFSGKLLVSRLLSPGINQIHTHLKGALIVNVFGSGYAYSEKVLVY